MNCHELESRLADYLGDELDEASHCAVEAHLESCDACRCEVAALRQTVDAMRRLDTVDALRAAAATRDLHVVRHRPLPWRLALGTMRAAALIGFGLLIGRVVVPPSADRAGEPTQVADRASPSAEGFNPKWRDRAAALGATRSSFARNLAIIAPAGPG